MIKYDYFSFANGNEWFVVILFFFDEVFDVLKKIMVGNHVDIINITGTYIFNLKEYPVTIVCVQRFL